MLSANQIAGFLSRLKNIGVGVVKTEHGHAGLRTLKLAGSQEGINAIN